MKAIINMGYINADIERDFLGDLVWRGALSLIYEAKNTREPKEKTTLTNRTKEALTFYNVISGKEEDDARELATNFLKLEKLI